MSFYRAQSSKVLCANRAGSFGAAAGPGDVNIAAVAPFGGAMDGGANMFGGVGLVQDAAGMAVAGTVVASAVRDSVTILARRRPVLRTNGSGLMQHSRIRLLQMRDRARSSRLRACGISVSLGASRTCSTKILWRKSSRLHLRQAVSLGTKLCSQVHSWGLKRHRCFARLPQQKASHKTQTKKAGY